jgi:hypothetical protein
MSSWRGAQLNVKKHRAKFTLPLQEQSPPRLVNKFPAFYTRRFIIVFTKARHWSYPEPDKASQHIIFIIHSSFDPHGA